MSRSVKFFIKYEIIFYIQCALPPPSQRNTPRQSFERRALMPILVLAFLWHYLWLAFPLPLPPPGLFVCFRGWFDVHSPFSTSASTSPPLPLIINCIIGFACCLLCPRQLVSPWGRFSPADGVLTVLLAPLALYLYLSPFLSAARTANVASQRAP